MEKKIEFADSISQCIFHENNLLVSSWDHSVSLIKEDKVVFNYQHNSPVLSVAWKDSTTSFSGDLSGQLKRCDLNTGISQNVGRHTDSIKEVHWLSLKQCCVTGSWDQTISLWDNDHQPVQKVVLPQKVFSMDISKEKIIVAMANRLIHIYDVRNMKEPFQIRESPLKYQTRKVVAFPDAETSPKGLNDSNGGGYIISSIEGRVAVEYLNITKEIQAKKFAFKCHRVNENGMENVYPVHSVAFHPSGSFATGGGDGVINTWDGIQKKRIRQFPAYPSSISSLSFNQDGNIFAIACSYAYEQGEKEHPTDTIILKSLEESDYVKK